MRSVAQRIALAREGGEVERCHCFRTIGNPTVGQHTFNAVSMLLILCPDPTINMIKALQFHDMAERFLGDMPATAKWKFPHLKEDYEVCEMRILGENGMLPALDEREKMWVHLMDVLDFYMYCHEQMLLGNRYAEQRMLSARKVLDVTPMPPAVLSFYRNYHGSLALLSDEECGI